jgi:hypothetical protein
MGTTKIQHPHSPLKELRLGYLGACYHTSLVAILILPTYVLCHFWLKLMVGAWTMGVYMKALKWKRWEILLRKLSMRMDGDGESVTRKGDPQILSLWLTSQLHWTQTSLSLQHRNKQPFWSTLAESLLYTLIIARW